MTTLIICEKKEQALNMKSAVGSDMNFVILHAQGHLYRLQDPQEVNPDWKQWTTDILMPPDGRYALVPNPIQGKGRLLQAIRDQIKQCQAVIIATDNDREGQAIGTDIVQQMRFKGTVKRAIFNNEDKKTLKDAVYSAESNDIPLYRRLYDAADARRQADQIFNLSLTRIVTLCLTPDDWKSGALGVGRVKTPTLGIVCERELELQNFTPKTYYVPLASIVSNGHTVKLRYKNKSGDLLFDKNTADAISSAIQHWKGKLCVATVGKHQKPERPMDINTLQKRCAKWGWSAKDVLNTAQSLYSTYKISSYPRTETRYLPNILEKDAEPMLRALHKLYPAATQWDTPIIRRGKNGIFSDEGIGAEPHHAIIPNINMLDQIPTIYAKLPEKEKRLFDLIAKSYIAALLPDYQYTQTTISIDFEFDGETHQFVTHGQIPLSLGWKAFIDDDNPEESSDTDAKETKLPPINDGDFGHVSEIETSQKATKPPSRYSQGDLVEAMLNAWKFVADPEMRDRLKQAKGIGTGATRDSIIEGLILQNWLTEMKGKVKHLIPTDVGMKVFLLLKEHAHWLVDPAFTAQMEMKIDAVLEGKLNKQDVIKAIANVAEKIKDRIIDISPPKIRSDKSIPSDAQVSAVEKIAEKKGLQLPADYKTNRKTCSDFLNQHIEKADNKTKRTKSSTLPSDKQIKYAKIIADKAKTKIPKSALQDRVKLNEWINKNAIKT